MVREGLAGWIGGRQGRGRKEVRDEVQIERKEGGREEWINGNREGWWRKKEKEG